MASYNIRIKRTAAREIEGLPRPGRARIIRRIAQLARDPRPVGCEKLSGAEKYRVRQGNYRIVCAVEDAIVTVFVIKVGHRSDVYRG